MLSTTLTTHADHASHYGLYVDNTVIARLWVDGLHDHQFDSASVDVVVASTRGQAVSVRHGDIGDHGLEGEAQSLFSGFLLQKQDRSAEIVG
ncbi:hypothetical protein DPMN_133952 [Dreissena polymorpha]|uniref:C1q domain-containing protein n=1 Tax=Dreissena polymorpha TaxID=45954 RepID=A0A9D4FWC1_DREPO|nr:hypothetical protein DPMN_133952 [Dreissena polymorpha]